ncbi:hypothetical protein EBI_25988 [Enterocytozoon bieneusi H348]|nr:hypothetical protein EBI_25988 [Enterocytozoon bieneusi H348]|eukprot:XP_002649986.1 hypothetical protein EBI_25988 [Enterocytozoon bieneusi H348]
MEVNPSMKEVNTNMIKLLNKQTDELYNQLVEINNQLDNTLENGNNAIDLTHKISHANKLFNDLVCNISKTRTELTNNTSCPVVDTNCNTENTLKHNDKS